MTFNIGSQKAKNISNVAGNQYNLRPDDPDLPESTPGHDVTVLLVAADPINMDRLRLGEEARTIEEQFRGGPDGRFALRQSWAARVQDLARDVVAYQPDVLHFSGHGSSVGDVILEDNSGQARSVSADALASLISASGNHVRCVVLNGCYTGRQAGALLNVVRVVIGTTNAIRDQEAIRFAEGLYLGLAQGRTVRQAFEIGRAAIQLHEAGDKSVVVLESSSDADFSL